MQLGRGSAPPSDQSVRDELDRIPECSTTLAGQYKWFEFPLLDPVFGPGGDQGSQGPDRVVAISQNIGPGGVREFTYCLSISHRGFPMGDPRFNPCHVIAGDA